MIVFRRALWHTGCGMVVVRRTSIFTSVSLVTGILALAAVGSAQTVRPDNYLGVSIGTFLPSDSLTRDIFGDAPISYGVSLVQPYRQARRGPRFDFSTLSLNNDGNNFFMVGATIGYEFRADRDPNKPVTFARVGIGPMYQTYDVGNGAFNASGNKFGVYGTGELGVTLTKNLILSARYYAMPDVDGLNFSGLQLSATIAAFKL